MARMNWGKVGVESRIRQHGWERASETYLPNKKKNRKKKRARKRSGKKGQQPVWSSPVPPRRDRGPQWPGPAPRSQLILAGTLSASDQRRLAAQQRMQANATATLAQRRAAEKARYAAALEKRRKKAQARREKRRKDNTKSNSAMKSGIVGAPVRNHSKPQDIGGK